MNATKIILICVLLVSVMLIAFFKPTNSSGHIKNTNDLRVSSSPSQQPKIISAIQNSLTLEQCIEIALESNPIIGSKRCEINEVNAQLSETLS